MKKRVFIIHGWEGYPEEGWFPWLKKEPEKRGFEVFVPAMPNTDEPKIEEWVPFLVNLVGEPDENTYFVGGSIGCQAIMRYMETLPDNEKIGGVVFVSGWFDLKEFVYKEEPEYEEEARDIARPWIETPINFKKIKKITNNFVAIFSDDDPYVEINNKDIFKKELGAEIIIEHNKGHFRGNEDGVFELPIVLGKILEISK
jgi:predicted alpha/beta hydrolase family esterase